MMLWIQPSIERKRWNSDRRAMNGIEAMGMDFNSEGGKREPKPVLKVKFIYMAWES